MLSKLDRGASKEVYNISMDNESWIYNYDPETKQQSAVWVFENEDKLTKVARGKNSNKK